MGVVGHSRPCNSLGLHWSGCRSKRLRTWMGSGLQLRRTHQLCLAMSTPQHLCLCTLELNSYSDTCPELYTKLISLFLGTFDKQSLDWIERCSKRFSTWTGQWWSSSGGQQGYALITVTCKLGQTGDYTISVDYYYNTLYSI